MGQMAATHGRDPQADAAYLSRDPQAETSVGPSTGEENRNRTASWLEAQRAPEIRVKGAPV